MGLKRFLTSVAATLVLGCFLSGCGGGTAGLNGSTAPAGTDTVAGVPTASQGSSTTRATTAGQAPKRYIVSLKPGATSTSVRGRHGVNKASHEFRHCLNGFAGELTPAQVQSLSADPNVALVEEDTVMTVNAYTPQTANSLTQTVPYGVRRIGSTRITGSGARVTGRVAIVDTGIDLTHPDLNVATNGVSFVTGVTSPNDDNGHGTHCAGIVGALDNGFGVVGVAPGVTVVPVKVLDSAGSGYTSAIISGLDWVAATLKDTDTTNDIRVANLSLGGAANSSLDTAVTNCINAGVTVVVAAGNNAADASSYSPARVAAAITVSAMTELNGLAGTSTTDSVTFTFGDGRNYTLYDNSFARCLDLSVNKYYTYSNYGTVVDLTAPGTDILSCGRGSTYVRMTGTSMAAPHVAGAAALYLAKYPGTTPANVATGLKTLGTSDYNSRLSISGKWRVYDGDATAEKLVNVSKL